MALVGSLPALTSPAGFTPARSPDIDWEQNNRFDFYHKEKIQLRRLTDVQKGISIARHRTSRFSTEPGPPGNMDKTTISDPLPVSTLGKQLEMFYYGYDNHRAGPNRKTKRDNIADKNQINRLEHATLSSSIAAEKHESPTQLAETRHELALPPLLSPAVWRTGDQAAAVDPAFIREPEVPLSDLPSPSRRFPLLCGPKRARGLLDGESSFGILGRTRSTRALPVCPTSNCRLISLSWDDSYFADDGEVDGVPKNGYYQTYGDGTVSSVVHSYGFPKRRPIQARGKCTEHCSSKDLRNKSNGYHDDCDVAGYRKHWKELVKDKGKLSEDDWKREDTGLLIQHVSTLLKTSKDREKL